MTIVIIIFVSVVIVFLFQANKEYKTADKNINSLILEAANATSSGDYNKAIQLLTSALHQNTMYHNLWNSRGENYIKLKMYEQALADFNKSISINPDRNMNYTAYTNKEKVENLITIVSLPAFETRSIDNILFSEIDWNQNCIYEISNMYPFEYGSSDDENLTLSDNPQSIIIDLKDNVIKVSNEIERILYKNEFKIVEKVKVNSEDYYLIQLLPTTIGGSHVKKSDIKIYYTAFGIDVHLKKNVIIFIETRLTYKTYVVFELNSNWNVKKY